MTLTAKDTTAPPTDFIKVVLDQDFNFYAYFDSVFFWIAIVLSAALLAWKIFGYFNFGSGRSFEIDKAEVGLGNQKLTLRPNNTDRQIAYQIWVELSTRKIGLPVDLENDVIVELYDSWYTFFSVTRELIKDVPVTKFRRKDTEKIIHLSIEVLNTGIRPHLTKWQARFRRWYEKSLELDENPNTHPQDVQKKFPDYNTLTTELEKVNKRLIFYREKMRQLATNL